MAYTLNQRQEIAFADTVSLYRPSKFVKGATKKILDPSYSSTPAYTGVKCRFQSTPFATEIQALGRENENTLLVLDQFRFHSSQEIADNWIIKLTTPGHPQLGNYWKVQGGKKSRVSSRRPTNEATIKAFLTTKPF